MKWAWASRSRHAANVAPWKDFEGKEIREGDVIRHPSGQQGVVQFWPHKKDPGDQWRVDYGDSTGVSRLCLQIGEKGQAAVVRSSAELERKSDAIQRLWRERDELRAAAKLARQALSEPPEWKGSDMYQEALAALNAVLGPKR